MMAFVERKSRKQIESDNTVFLKCVRLFMIKGEHEIIALFYLQRREGDNRTGKITNRGIKS